MNDQRSRSQELAEREVRQAVESRVTTSSMAGLTVVMIAAAYAADGLGWFARDTGALIGAAVSVPFMLGTVHLSRWFAARAGDRAVEDLRRKFSTKI